MTATDPGIAPLLIELLEACEAGGGAVHAQRFRADHPSQLKLMDQLVRQRIILAEQERYRVGLTALTQLVHPLATRLLETMETLWKGLRDHYQLHLNAQIGVPDLARACGLDVETAQQTLRYMLEASWSAGYSPGGDAPIERIGAGEIVLHHQMFTDLIEQLRSGYNVDDLFGLPRGWQAIDVTRESHEILSTYVSQPTLPAWLPKLPLDAQTLLPEVHGAVGMNLNTLAAMGIRAVVDVVCQDQLGGDKGGFESKLKGLHDAGHLNAMEHSALSAVVDAGNAAAHRGFSPDASSVKAMLDALNHCLFSVYVLRQLTEDLSLKTPARPSLKRLRADPLLKN